MNARLDRELATVRAAIREHDAAADACAHRMIDTPSSSPHRPVVVGAALAALRARQEAHRRLLELEQRQAREDWRRDTGRPWEAGIDPEAIRREVAATTARIRRETDAELGEHAVKDGRR